MATPGGFLPSHVLNHHYSESGHLTGKNWIVRVEGILTKRKLPFVVDAPSEALGNCLPYSVMQQLHRPNVWVTLQDDLKSSSQSCHDLRLALVNFVANITPSSEFFEH